MKYSYVKKAVLTFFVALFFYNYIVTSVYFQYEICAVKSASERRLKEELHENLERIAIHRQDIGKSLNFKEEDEFWYEGKLYDVKSQLENADSVIYYCINDSEEENLLLEVKDTFFRFLNNLSASAATERNTSLKISWQLFAEDKADFNIDTKYFCTIIDKQFIYNSINLSPDPPPPKSTVM